MPGQRLEGKRALVTAAGQGIGRASALAMAAEGAQVFATDVNVQALSTIREANHENIEIFELDAMDDASIRAGVERARPDVLFNCAGFVHHGTVQEATEDEWDFAFDLNVRSMMRTIRAALPGMLERGSGSIINMSSACSSLIGAPNRFIYGTTKAAVIGLDQIGRGGFCDQRHPLQLHLPGHGGKPELARPGRGARQETRQQGGGAEAVRVAPTHGPRGHCRRDRGAW